MKMSKFYKCRLGFILFFFGLSQIGITQIEIVPPFKPHVYASVYSYGSRDFTEVEQNSLFTEGYLVTTNLGLTVGYQLHEAIGLELSYLNRGLEVSNAFGENKLVRVSGITNINTFSLSINNSIPLIYKRLYLKPKIGYVIGWHGLAENHTTPGSSGNNGELYTSTSTEVLKGGRLDFILMGLGLELNITRRISLGLGYMRHQGFTNLAKSETEYEYLGEQGTVQSITNGMIAGLEFSLKFRFK